MRRFCDRLAAAALTGLVLAAFCPASTLALERGEYHIEPEYERKLEKVVLSLETTTDDFLLHQSIIERLPVYTDILLLLPEEKYAWAKEEIEGMGFAREVKLLEFDTDSIEEEKAYVLFSGDKQLKKKVLKNSHRPRGSVWAQDLFEPARTDDGGTVVLAPYMHKWFMNERRSGQDRVFRDNLFLEELESADVPVEQSPLVFKGGNVLVDVLDGRTVAFVGGDVIRDTILVLNKARGVKASGRDVEERLRRFLNIDDVIVVGGGKSQPSRMFHLDQAMVLFPGRVAGVTRIVGDEKALRKKDVAEAARFLAELRAKLGELGYEIVDILASVEDVLDYSYYANGVPYVSKTTGLREYLMPFFESSLEGMGREIFEINKAAIEALGYRVVPVPTKANERHGGIHCLVNVIR
jgi:hypothetical protein